jgi:hypothetical protein
MAGAARISSQTVFSGGSASGLTHFRENLDFLCRREVNEGEENENGADNRQEKTGGMKQRAIRGPGENAGDQSAHDGTTNADEGRDPKSHVADLWHEPVGNETDNKADKNRPDNVEHGVSFFGGLGEGYVKLHTMDEATNIRAVSFYLSFTILKTTTL